MKVINTICFTSNEAFVDWQKEKQHQVIQVIPIATQIGADVEERSINGDITQNLFVTYLVDEDACITNAEKEVRYLENLIFNMTHHEGAMEETKDQWIEVINRRLKSK